MRVLKIKEPVLVNNFRNCIQVTCAKMTACSTANLSFKGKLYAAADGFGADLKNAVIEHLRQQQFDIEDLGTEKYFVAAEKVSRAVQKGGRQAGDINQPETVRGLLFCGSGMGVAIIANKFQGVAAAVVENEHAARCSRAINDTNIICLHSDLIL